MTNTQKHIEKEAIKKNFMDLLKRLPAYAVSRINQYTLLQWNMAFKAGVEEGKLDTIKRVRKEVESYTQDDPRFGSENYGYNKAISDILTILKKMEEEG